MEAQAKKQLYSEERNWLNRGRVTLLGNLLASVKEIDGPVLDIGAGSGHAIPTLKQYGEVDAIELAPEAQEYLKQKPVRTIYTEGLPQIKVDQSYKTIVGLEVLEHIEDEKGAISWVDNHLDDNGYLLLTVPAYQWLFGPHDVANQHFRRYTKGRLLKALPEYYTLVRSGYFITGLFPLAVASKLAFLLKNKMKKKDQTIKKQSSNLPKFADKIFFTILKLEAEMAKLGISMPFGLTVYVLAQKKKG
tara:strand:- start:4791 stop:5531 length:741 start_codon:yes stop_codon:yes gene_type:complete